MNGSKTGDYIAAVSLHRQESAELVKDISGHYRMVREQSPSKERVEFCIVLNSFRNSKSE